MLELLVSVYIAMNEGVEVVLSEFASHLGVADHINISSKIFCVDMDYSGRFCVESVAEGAFVYLSRGYQELEVDLFEKAMGLCYSGNMYGPLIRVGLSENNLIYFSLKIPTIDVGISSLFDAFRDLNRCHEKLTEGIK